MAFSISIIASTVLVLINLTSWSGPSFNVSECLYNDSKLNIRYDERVETLALIFNLSESGEAHFRDNPAPRAMLARTLTARFSLFKNHEAVRKLNMLLKNDLVDSYDILISLYSSEFPEYEQTREYPSIYYEHDEFSKEEIISMFTDFHISVLNFYVDAGLKEFFRVEGKPLYDKLMAEVRSVAPQNNYTQQMEDYYGIRRNSYTILVSAFSFNGIGRSVTISSESGTDIYQFVSSDPDTESDMIELDRPDSFTIGYTNEQYFREIAVHELGHSFFHEALRENDEIIAMVNDIRFLFTDSLKVSMRAQGYTDWNMTFEEHLVRLGEITMAQRSGHNDFAEQYMATCIQERGFIYLGIIQQVFSIYENN
ncbi:MAG TPA: hypothetical protein DEQ34_05805, partial [Balneolaceae bacterium]|nr:hypothetical protein [Balneolaceae bacterium]